MAGRPRTSGAHQGYQHSTGLTGPELRRLWLSLPAERRFDFLVSDLSEDAARKLFAACAAEHQNRADCDLIEQGRAR